MLKWIDIPVDTQFTAGSAARCHGELKFFLWTQLQIVFDAVVNVFGSLDIVYSGAGILESPANIVL